MAATVISLGVVKDGVSNVRFAVGGLMDSTARTVDNQQVDPLVRRGEDHLASQTWIANHQVRVRDLGHVFPTEVRLVPHDRRADLHRLRQVEEDLRAMDWKIDDVTVAPSLDLDRGPDTDPAGYG